MEQDMIKVLIVDDSATYRRVVQMVLSDLPDIEVVGTAANGKIALEKISRLSPDLLTLDIEMPILDGLAVLREIKEKNLPVGAIVLSAFTDEGAEATIRALKLGAFDFILKPTTTSMEESLDLLRKELVPRINAYKQTLVIKRLTATRPSIKFSDSTRLIEKKAYPKGKKPAVVCIGISTGGPQSLAKVIPHLPSDFPLPILIVQHMPPKFTESLAFDLDKRSKLKVKQAENGERVNPGIVYIAPGGKQMKVSRLSDDVIIRITDDPPVNNCKPAVDYLFRSVAYVYGGRAIAVIMTGMGTDGAIGCKLLKREGAIILAQSPETCVVYGMPRIPTEEGIVDSVVHLEDIADKIVEYAAMGSPSKVCSG